MRWRKLAGFLLLAYCTVLSSTVQATEQLNRLSFKVPCGELLSRNHALVLTRL